MYRGEDDGDISNSLDKERKRGDVQLLNIKQERKREILPSTTNLWL